MDENQLQAFLTVSKEKNFTQASKLLYVSQPAISKRIRTLEEELGYELFIRSKNYVELSKDGKIFYPYAEEAFEILKKARLAFEPKNILSDMQRPLRFGSTNVISLYVLPNLLNEFKTRFPNTKIDLFTKPSSEIKEMILNEDIDLGIVQDMNLEKQLESIPLFEEQYTLVISKDLLDKRKPSFRIEDFPKYQVIQYRKRSFWEPIENLFKNHNINLNCTIQSDSAESIKRLVKSGIGLSFLPSFIVTKEMGEDLYTSVQIEHITLPYRKVSLVFLSKNFKLAQSFIKGLDFQYKSKQLL